MIPSFTVNDVPIECINQAAVDYHVPAVLIVSVLKTEDGRNGMASPNKNGTYDFGPMQINSRWLPRLQQFGISQHDIQYNPCINVGVGAWILGTSIADRNQLWPGVGDYHSHTWNLNQSYNTKVRMRYEALNQYLNKP